MGRSSGYCFKIIACGSNSESVDRDDLDASSENKGSVKRGWSFRKRSAGHRVLSNSVITEISSSVNKSSEPVIINSEAPISSSVSEKASANLWPEELPRVSTSATKGGMPPNLSTEAADENEIKLDSSADESSVIVIQAAVRKFLAQRELVKHKKVVKLQAAVRGHLVRCRATGSLHCILAILKMQALVRARHANMSVEKTYIGKEDSRTRPHPTYISIEKLLSNHLLFRINNLISIKLLESTRRTKQIKIKCNPSSDDSAWKWLERWTCVSSPQVRPTSFPGKHLLEDEQPKRPAKRAATEQVDFERRKSVFGSRKASNPTFIAAHSRFEELTSKNNSVGSSGQEHMVKSSTNSNSIQLRDVEPGESLVYESLKVGQSPTAGSECGTELSVTSMLDSPDPSEVGNVEYEKEAKNLDKEAGSDIKSIGVKEHTLLGTELTHSTFDCNTDVAPAKQSYEDDTSNADIELEHETGRKSKMHRELETQIHRQVDKSSPEASPRSHVTAHGTPSSQMLNNNKTKTDRKISSQRSNSEKSPVSGSLRNGPRERKHGKRRDSFGCDQEARESGSSNCIPSYMQVTESARAKAVANSSPRSSPDVQGKVKEAYMKKRHSLHGAVNGRHGSPRVERTSPQTTKGNNPERKLQN